MILKEQAKKLSAQKGMTEQFDLFERVERLSPEVFEQVKGVSKVICANVVFILALCMICSACPVIYILQSLLSHALPGGVLTALKN